MYSPATGLDAVRKEKTNGLSQVAFHVFHLIKGFVALDIGFHKTPMPTGNSLSEHMLKDLGQGRCSMRGR